MSGVVISEPVAQALGAAGRAQVEQTLRGGPVPCQACGGQLRAATDGISVRAHLAFAGRPAPVVVVDFVHTRCGPSELVTDAAAEALVHELADTSQDAVAMLGELNGHPTVAFDAQISAYLDVGGDTTDASTTAYLRSGFTLITAPPETLDPREVPVLRDWVVRLTADQLWIGRPGDPPLIAYVQDRTAEAADWVASARPGPVLLLTGGGVAPASGRELDGDAWAASIESARLSGRLVAARVPLRAGGANEGPPSTR